MECFVGLWIRWLMFLMWMVRSRWRNKCFVFQRKKPTDVPILFYRWEFESLLMIHRGLICICVLRAHWIFGCGFMYVCFSKQKSFQIRVRLWFCFVARKLAVCLVVVVFCCYRNHRIFMFESERFCDSVPLPSTSYFVTIDSNMSGIFLRASGFLDLLVSLLRTMACCHFGKCLWFWPNFHVAKKEIDVFDGVFFL